MRIYIAGPMSGLKDWNYPAFHAAAAAWRNAGWSVVNPAEAFGGDTTRPYSDYVQTDLAVLQTCQAIALLTGWDGPTARGSVWERYVAEMVFGLEVFDARYPQPPKVQPATIKEFVQQAVPLTRHPVSGRLGRHWQIELELARAIGQADGETISG